MTCMHCLWILKYIEAHFSSTVKGLHLSKPFFFNRNTNSGLDRDSWQKVGEQNKKAAMYECKHERNTGEP